MNGIGAIFSAIASFFSWATGRSALKNAADVKAAKVGQTEADAQKQTNEAIQNKNLDEIRKELAE